MLYDAKPMLETQIPLPVLPQPVPPTHNDYIIHNSFDNTNCNQKKILIVDDDPPIRAFIRKVLESCGYTCFCAESALSARDALTANPYDLVLSDINMPGESGLDFIQDVLHDSPETAAIMISGINDSKFAKSIIDVGVYDYIIKPLDRNAVLISVANALRRQQLEASNRIMCLDLENKVKDRTKSLQRSMQQLEKAMNGIVQAMAYTVETRDPYTAGHQRRVTDLAVAMAGELDYNQDKAQAVNVAATVHDLGKISIPAEILSKPSVLSENEFNLIKEHTQVGYDIIKEIEFPWDVATIVRQHHEKLDGSGYPRGLKGDEIMPESRVVMVADVVEAMASHRPYRPGLGIDAALDEIKSKEAVHYDSEAVKACVHLFESGSFAFD